MIFKIEDVDYLKDENVFQNYYNLLPLFRKEKIDKLHFFEDKILSLGAWILLQKMLKENQLIEEESFPEIIYTKTGKPLFNHRDDLFFNLSHSGKKVMCVIGNVPVGCDIEKISYKKEECVKLANRFYNQTEANKISNLPDDLAIIEFYKFWTQKEAFSKCYDTPLPKVLPLNLQDYEKIISNVENCYVYSVISAK